MSTVRVRVLDGYAVHDGGRHRIGGELVEVDSDTAAEWIAAGWVTPVKVTRTK